MPDVIQLCLAGFLLNEVVYNTVSLDKIENWVPSWQLPILSLVQEQMEKKRNNWKGSQFEEQQIYQGKTQGSYSCCQNETRANLISLQMLCERWLQLCLLSLLEECECWNISHQRTFRFNRSAQLFVFSKSWVRGRNGENWALWALPSHCSTQTIITSSFTTTGSLRLNKMPN